MSARKYGPTVQKSIKKEVSAHKHQGKYQSRQQAVAVGLDKARRKGAKVPSK